MSDQYLTLVPLAYVTDGDSFVVGPQDGSDFVELPEIGALIARALQLGHSVREVEALVAIEVGEPMAIDDFLAQLDDLGWITGVSDAPPPAPRSFTRHPAPWWIRMLFSRTAWAFYLTCAVLDIVLLVTGAGHVPSITGLMSVHTPVVALGVLTIVGAVTLVVHEFWHQFAGRAAGIDARISIGRRWLTPVAQTDLSKLWLLPRSARFGPLLAGMAIDCVLMAVALLAQVAGVVGSDASTTGMLAGALVLTLLLGIGFQFQVYMRTDGYALLTTAFGCRDLSRVTAAVVRRRIRRATPTDEDVLEFAHPNDLRAVPVFLLVVLVGLSWSVWFFVTVAGPGMFASGTWVIDTFGGSAPLHEVLQAALLVTLCVVEIGWVGIAFARERGARRRERERVRVLAPQESS